MDGDETGNGDWRTSACSGSAEQICLRKADQFVVTLLYMLRHLLAPSQ